MSGGISSKYRRRIRLRLWVEQDGGCFWCGRPMLRETDPGYSKKHHQGVTLDHVIPLGCGGGNQIGNLVAACRQCNMDRGTMPAIEWVAKLRDDKRAQAQDLDAVLSKLTRFGISPQSANPATAPMFSFNPLNVQPRKAPQMPA